MYYKKRGGGNKINIMEQKEKELTRYFMVVYIAIHARGWSNGNMKFTTNGNYLNEQATLSMIEGSNPIYVKGSTIISNIIEFNRSDFEEWDRK